MRSHDVRRLFGIRLPIVQAGMVYVSGGKLAAAAAEAGVLGMVGAGSMQPELLRQHLRKARANFLDLYKKFFLIVICRNGIPHIFDIKLASTSSLTIIF